MFYITPTFTLQKVIWYKITFFSSDKIITYVSLCFSTSLNCVNCSYIICLYYCLTTHYDIDLTFYEIL